MKEAIAANLVGGLVFTAIGLATPASAAINPSSAPMGVETYRYSADRIVAPGHFGGRAFVFAPLACVIAVDAGGTVSSKGLKAGQSVNKMKRLYPSTRRTATFRSENVGGWHVYSARNKTGWLDYYKSFGKSDLRPYFAVRAL